jgi:hypothetical protein
VTGPGITRRFHAPIRGQKDRSSAKETPLPESLRTEKAAMSDERHAGGEVIRLTLRATGPLGALA